LNSEGFAAGCEGDEASLVSMEIIRVLGFPSFQCNPYAIDIGGRNISLAHCSVPFSMVESYSLMTHYESGLGIGVRGKFAEGEKVTLFKMAPDLRSYHLFVGTLLRNDERADACRTQIEVRLDNPPTDLLAHPYGNHLLLARGDMSDSLSLLLSGYGILQAKTDI
jgi:L-fucose isomerase-like protein